MKRAPSKAKKLPAKPSSVKAPRRPSHDSLAHMLARSVREGHGEDQAATFDQSEELGSPRGYIGTRNIALDRAMGCRIPLGRIVEFFGLNASGKSTAADQVGAQCQIEGGMYGVADTERNRQRAYMADIGVQNESTLWIGGRTVEELFEEIETIARLTASGNLLAWKQALDLAGFKTPSLPTSIYSVFDPFASKKNRKATAKFKVYEWSMDHAVALKKYQIANDLTPSGVRDMPTRAHLRPVLVYDTEGQIYSGDLRNSDYKATVDYARGESDEEGPLGWHWGDRPVVLCWDSVGGTPTKEEVNDTAADAHVASHAKVIKQNLRRLVQLIDDAAITLLCVNQEYNLINKGGFGPKRQTFGGEGLRYHACIRVEFKRIGWVKQGDEKIGQIVECTPVKNKLAPPWRSEQFALIFGRGADNAWAIFEDLKRRGIIVQRGAWNGFSDPELTEWVGGNFRGWMGLSDKMAADYTLYNKLAEIYMEGRS